MLRSLLSASLVLGLGAFAQAGIQSVAPSAGGSEPGFGTFPAGDVIFDNIGPNGGYNPDGASPESQLDLQYPFDLGVADDFTLNGDFFIEGVNWVGLISGGSHFEIPSFNIIFWPDDNGVPAGGTPVGNPPDYSQVAAFYDIAGNANEVSNGDGTFSYSVDLPVPFQADGGTTYWLEVQPVFPFPPSWAFQVTFGSQGHHAVQGFSLEFLGLPFWTEIADPGDLAFQLTGTPVPEPGTLLLLGCGTLALIRRRRQSERGRHAIRRFRCAYRCRSDWGCAG